MRDGGTTLNWRRPAAALLAAALVGGCARAPEPETSGAKGRVTATLSTNVLHVGDPLRLTVTVEHPKEARIQWPEIGRGKDVIVRSQDFGTQPAGTDTARTTAAYDLTSFVVGTHLVSTGKVVVVHADGTRSEAVFPDVEFAVHSVLSGPDEALRGIKGLARWPAAFPRWLAGLLIVAALAVVIGLVVARLIAKPRTILHYPPPPPPHEVALRALQQLLSSGWIEQGRIEPFYVKLSSIARRYIEDRFLLRAPERTTEEFIREAAASRVLSDSHQALTRDFLEQCDLVKFARHHPEHEDMRSAYDAAERLVRETIPVPASAANEEPSTTPGSP